MPRRDADALAVWDAKARTAIDRIDAALEDNGATETGDLPPSTMPSMFVRRVIDRSTPPPGEIITPPAVHLSVDHASTPAPRAAPPTNMSHQPDRIDHWDAYVCRFDDDDAEPDEATG